MSVGPRAEKFNIVSNDHGHTHKWTFPFSRGNSLYGQKKKKKKKKKEKSKL